MTKKSPSSISRRAFGVLAGASAALHGKPVRANETSDVIVIGAGLAGLTAAWRLVDQGLSVTVLEGASRMGGRVWSAEQEWDTANGMAPIELGASQIGPSYARFLDAAERLGLEMVKEDRELLPFASHVGGKMMTDAEWADSPSNPFDEEFRELGPVRVGGAILGKYNPLVDLDDWLDPKFAEHDISQADLMRRNGFSEAALELASISGTSTDAHSSSVLGLYQERTRGQFELRFAQEAPPTENPVEDVRLVGWPRNLVGGTEAMTNAIAEQLPNGVQLNKQVIAIDMDDTGVDVRTMDGSRYRAKRVIAAVPFSVLRYMSIWPEPHTAMRRAIKEIGYAETTRAFCNIKEPFWEEDGYPGSLWSDGALRMFWAIENHGSNRPYRGMFVMTGRSGQQVAAQPPEAAEQFLLDELARLRPSSKGQIEMLRFHSWDRQPLQRGCRHMFAPGQVNAFARDMTEPHQRMHVAGEHTRRQDFGMEAAMESGERAAIEVLEGELG